jgi:hypothetical protein
MTFVVLFVFWFFFLLQTIGWKVQCVAMRWVDHSCMRGQNLLRTDQRPHSSFVCSSSCTSGSHSLDLISISLNSLELLYPLLKDQTNKRRIYMCGQLKLNFCTFDSTWHQVESNSGGTITLRAFLMNVFEGVVPLDNLLTSPTVSRLCFFTGQKNNRMSWFYFLFLESSSLLFIYLFVQATFAKYWLDIHSRLWTSTWSSNWQKSSKSSILPTTANQFLNKTLQISSWLKRAVRLFQNNIFHFFSRFASLLVILSFFKSKLSKIFYWLFFDFFLKI